MNYRFASQGSRRRRLIAATAVAGLGITACSNVGEKIIEEGVERAIENESGEDVEIDFNSDGGLTFESDEGSVRIGEDGSFIIEGEDGEVFTGQQTDDGFQLEGEDGSQVISVDEDGGNVQIESQDADGNSFSAGPGIPAEWPTLQVLPPAGLTDVNNSVIVAEGEMLMTLAGTAPGGAGEYYDTYTAILETAGFNRASYVEGDGFKVGSYEGNGYQVAVTSNEASSTIALNLMPLPD
jgi:hypothetical protein